MQEHINSLTIKYFAETIKWNTVNRNMPTSYEQSYTNAEDYLQAQGARILKNKIVNYEQRLVKAEIDFVELLIKPME